MARFLIDQVTAPFDPDLSAPEKAIMTCARAAELASPSYYNCLDWDAIYEIHDRALPDAIAALKLSKEQGEKVVALWRRLGKEYWVGLLKKAIAAERGGADLSTIGAEHARSVGPEAKAAVPGAIPAASVSSAVVAEIQRSISDFKAFQAELDEDLLKRNGLKVDRRNPRGRIEVRKMGIRVEAVARPSPDRAWIAVAGRNLDGSIYRCSAFLVKVGGGLGEWKERHPFPEDMATLPPGWPPVLSSYAADFAKARAYLMVLISSGEASPR